MSASKVEAKNRIGKSLKKIEAAQRLISEASSDLSRIVGVSENYDHLDYLYYKIKAAWHELNMRASSPRIDLDSDEKRKPEFQS